MGDKPGVLQAQTWGRGGIVIGDVSRSQSSLLIGSSFTNLPSHWLNEHWTQQKERLYQQQHEHLGQWGSDGGVIRQLWWFYFSSPPLLLSSSLLRCSQGPPLTLPGLHQQKFSRLMEPNTVMDRSWQEISSFRFRTFIITADNGQRCWGQFCSVNKRLVSKILPSESL